MCTLVKYPIRQQKMMYSEGFVHLGQLKKLLSTSERKGRVYFCCKKTPISDEGFHCLADDGFLICAMAVRVLFLHV